MPREKIAKPYERRLIVYDYRRWRILKKLRAEAASIMQLLVTAGLNPIIHGSVARGDVSDTSDIDIVVTYPVPSYRIEYVLEQGGYTIYQRIIVMATPRSTPKAYLVLDPEERINISFPLARLQPREIEFYWFGGALTYRDLLENKRVPGIDKRLMLIEPIKNGHIETSVIGREEYAARIIGISIDTVLERIRVLSRRDAVGRTGVFVKHVVPIDSSFEKELRRIAARNPWVRRVLNERGY